MVMDWRTPSSTTKSLPAPCMFTTFQIMVVIIADYRWFVRKGSVESGLAFRPGLEPPMHPVILRRVGSDPAFYQAIQAGRGVFRRLFAGEGVQRRQDVHVIAACLGIEAADDGHDGGIPGLGDLGSCQQRGRRHIAKWQ